MLAVYTNIKAFRVGMQMSQTQLAKKVGYTDRSSIAKIESGVVDLSYEKIIEFADALEVTPQQLMGWEAVSWNPHQQVIEIEDNKIDLSEEDQILLDAFHNADDIAKYSVLRILGIKD